MAQRTPPPTTGPERVRWSLTGPVADALRARAIREDRIPEREAVRILADALRESGDLTDWPSHPTGPRT
jgi:hypothetical protein